MLHARHHGWLWRVIFAALLLQTAAARATEVLDPLTDAKLRDAWLEQKSDKSKGGITATAKGLVLRSEPRMYVSVKRTNTIVGSDSNPLSVSVHMLPTALLHGGDLPPSLFVYWDAHNFVQVYGSTDNHVWATVRKDGVDSQRPFYNQAPEAKKNGVYLRVVLVSRNTFIYSSPDGVNWRQLASMGSRPGKEGVAPNRIILGRGWTQELNNREARGDLANDSYPDGRKNLIETTYRDFRIYDSPEPLPAEKVELEANNKSWDDLVDSLEAATIPKTWTMLGPVPDSEFKVWKQTLPADTTDDWKTPPNDHTGKPFRSRTWSHPDDATESYVDFTEILEPNRMVLAYARTEVDWPLEGSACLWFDGNGKSSVAVNNERVLVDEPVNWRGTAIKDRYCRIIKMQKGKNLIKVKSGQMHGKWGFFLRIERNDPGHRIMLLTRLLELFPEDAKGWRGAQAMLEIARRHEQMLNFPLAVDQFQKTIDAFAGNDEYRTEAFEGKLRVLETLRNWSGLAAAGEQYLAKYGHGAGFASAFRACVVGEAMAGKLDAAEARVSKYVEDSGADSDRIVWALRLLAGAAENSGKQPRQFVALERLGANQFVDKRERARAYFESAAMRMHVEHVRAQREKLDPLTLTAACAAWKAGVALLPSATNPQVQLFLADADADLKAGKHERAAAGGWGAALLALCAADADAAPLIGVNKPHKLPMFGVDAAGKPKELNEAVRAESWTVFGPAIGQIKLKGWKAIGPFDNADAIGERTAYGPETDRDATGRHPGRGGDKSWIDLDPKLWHDLGQELKQLGDCKDGIAYVSSEFEVPEARSATLYLSARAGWVAWLDGKHIGENLEATFRLDGTRMPLQLSAGKHRLLLKLVAPADAPFTFRVRIGDEAELTANILRAAWLQREFPDIRRLYDFCGDLQDHTLGFTHNKSVGPAVKVLGDAIATVYSGKADVRFYACKWPCDLLVNQGYPEEVTGAYRKLLMRLETGTEFVEQAQFIWETSAQLYSALLQEGESLAADEVLRNFIARHPDMYNAAGPAVVNRATMRQDFSLSISSRPHFERAVREYPQAHDNFKFAVPGLAYARTWLPERAAFETSPSVETSIDAASRQIKAGNEADVEKAMRHFSEVLRDASDSLINVDGSRFTPRSVGLREYFRALLLTLTDDMRAVYLRTVAGASEARYRTAAEFGDVAQLEAMAGEYYFTPAAMQALNSAGNIYMDRGAFAQAAAAFKYILQEYQTLPGIDKPLLLAKLARASLLSGQFSAASAAAQQLAQEHAGASLKIGGKTQTGAQVSQLLQQQVKQASSAQTVDSVSTTHTYAANLQRTGAPLVSPAPKPGPLAWVRSHAKSAGQDMARAHFWPDPFSHVQSHPVVADGKVFVGSLEAVQAYDLNSGTILWRQAWGGLGSLVPRQFTGFPISCPTVSDGRVYMRVMDGKQSGLRCFAADSGRMIWSTSSVPQLKKAVWISEPLVAYGLAIAAFFDPGDRNIHGIAAIDALTGRFRWKQYLVNGQTGIRTNNINLGSSMQLGPAAADRGVVYAQTGLGSIVALNAFTGEVVWLSCYPRLHLTDLNNGNSGATTTMRIRTLKLMSRGPMSPIVGEDVVVLAPKDASGIFAFDRRTGAMRWKLDMVDSRFLAGVCEGNLLVCDNTVRAINIDTGVLAWEYSLQGETLYGQPGYSGGVLYLPTEDRLQLVDARTGKLQSTAPWDPRVGPLANFAVTNKAIIGANEEVTAAIGPPGTAAVELPLHEAQAALNAGNHEKAAEYFARALKSPATEDVLAALSGWVKTLELTGKKDAGLPEIERVLADRPDVLSSPSSFWRVAKNTFAENLRGRLGQPTPVPAAVPDGVSGALAYAWQLEGESPRLFFPEDGARDRFYALAGYNLYAMRLSTTQEMLWQVYVGPDVGEVRLGPDSIAVVGQQKLSLIDRSTGELLWHTFLPTDKKKQRARANAVSFSRAAINDKYVAVCAGQGIFVYDLRTGKEVWNNEKYQRGPLFLAFVNDKLVEFSHVGGQDTFYAAYDQSTGRRVGFATLAKKTDGARPILAPDGTTLIHRLNANMLIGLDLETGKEKWKLPVPSLDPGQTPWLSMRLLDNELVVAGDARDGPDKGWVTLFINPADGKVLRKLIGGSRSVGKSAITFNSHWGKIIARVDSDAKGFLKDPTWSTALNDNLAVYHSCIDVIVSQNRAYIFYGRSDGPNDQYVLRTMDWETGQVLNNEFLPGTPVRTENGAGWLNTVYLRGNLLMYAAQEGLFVYTPVGQTRSESTVRLRELLARPDLAARERRDTRKALNAIDPPTLRAFIAPPEAKPDAELSEWASTDPLPIQGAQDFVPLAPDAKWEGPADLAARIYAAWNSKGIFVAVEVDDDLTFGPLPGAPLSNGDSVRIAVNSTTDPVYGFLNQETVVCSLAVVDGMTVLNVSPEPDPDDTVLVQGNAVRSPNGKGYRYEVLIPWQVLKRDPRNRPGDRKEMRLGVAVYDDDGKGADGALEWGAGVCGNSTVPVRLGQMSLLDVSREKIERYRKVIAMLPDAYESLKFLELILLSKRGENAQKERIAELENFVKSFPDRQNTNRVLSLLRAEHKAAGEADPAARTIEFAKSAKCPPSVVENLSTKVLRVWVLPDAKNPPRTIMVQFNIKGASWCRRAYWGANSLEWGRDSSVERRLMGPMPRPGEWTQLEIHPIDFEIEESEVVGIAFSSHGGLLHWDRLSVIVDGKETLLMDDAIPPKFRAEGNPFQFTAAPHKSGTSSWTGGPAAKEMNPFISTADGSTWFSFRSASAPKAPELDPVAQQKVLRQAASLLNDSPEGFVFLRRVTELITDKKNFTPLSINEYEEFLQKHPDTTNALAILQQLRQAYKDNGDKDPMARCEKLIDHCKLPRDSRRAFYASIATVWMDWHVLGPIMAKGDRRGQDVSLPLERNIDLAFVMKEGGPGNIDLPWTRITAPKDKAGTPILAGPVNIFTSVVEKLDNKSLRAEVARGAHYAYAYVKFTVPTQRRALLLYGVNDVASIWVNGRKVVTESYSGFAKDREVKEINLRNGENEVLLKVGVAQGQLQFFFRIANENGRPFPDLTISDK